MKEKMCIALHTMKTKWVAAPLFVLCLLAANPVWAAVQMSTVSVPTAMTEPLSGFSIDYTMIGSKSGVGAAAAQVTFYISASPTGSTGVATLASFQIPLRGSGLGPYLPPIGTQSYYVSRFSMPANTVALLENITAACQPQTWYILGSVDGTGVSSDNTVLGTTKQPDFYFTGGTISPSSIAPGGTTNISFDVFTACPTAIPSTVGIYLADANLEPLAYIGGITIGAGSGTSSLPPTGITFSSAIAPGLYHVVLVADVDGVITESNENNNVGAFTLNITAPALKTVDSKPGALEPDLGLPADFIPVRDEPRSGEPKAFFTSF
ncbi:hypothetical protein [Cystobacter ferrugineus]|nr:hypothetical protein [Cystobacter ferrugineus]